MFADLSPLPPSFQAFKVLSPTTSRLETNNDILSLQLLNSASALLIVNTTIAELKSAQKIDPTRLRIANGTIRELKVKIGALDEKVERLEAIIHKTEKESVAQEIKGSYQAEDEYLDGLMQNVCEAKAQNDRRYQETMAG